MSTPQPPSDGDRPEQPPVEPAAAPATGESVAAPAGDPAPGAATEPPAVAKKTPARRPAARRTTGTGSATGKTTTPRKRASSKSAPLSPVGEAPDIMDATLGTSTPLAAQATTAQSKPAQSSPAQTGSVESASARGEAPHDAAEAGDETAELPESVATNPSAPAALTESTDPVEPTIPPTGQSADGAAAGPADAGAHGSEAPRRSVVDLADRLDDSRFFSALFDFTFRSYVTRRLAGPVYVVGLVLIALAVLVGFSQSLAIAVSTHSPAGAFAFLLGVLVTLVAAILAVLLLRVGIEVFVAIIEIAQNTRGRRRPPRD